MKAAVASHRHITIPSSSSLGAEPKDNQSYNFPQWMITRACIVESYGEAVRCAS